MEKKTLSKLTEKEERKYSIFWLIFWIIFCFPVAYYYYFKKQYPPQKILKEKPQKYIFLGLIILYVAIYSISTLTGDFQEYLENPTYTNDALYNCQNGDYSFPESEPIFKDISISLIDFDGLEENKCAIFPDYKIKIKPDPSNPYYEMDTDICDLTISQLAYFKEKKVDLMTMLKDASCDFKTNLFLPEVGKTLDFKGQVKEILGEFGISTTEFTASFEEWTTSIISYEEFQEAIKNEKKIASKSFKDLKDLQPANSEETEIQNKATKVVELYLDSLNSMEESLAQQSQAGFEDSMSKSTAQMDEAITKMLELVKLLE